MVKQHVYHINVVGVSELVQAVQYSSNSKLLDTELNIWLATVYYLVYANLHFNCMTHTHHWSEIAVRFVVAYKAQRKTVCLNHSSIARSLAHVLYQQGLIHYFSIDNLGIHVHLKYIRGKPLWHNIEIISKPGRRVYWTVKRMKSIYSHKNFSGVYIVSTPQGLCSSSECVLGLRGGGEIIYKIKLL